MIVISDSTPLINFAKLGRLDLLRKLFGKVCIPEAVYYEVVIEGAGKPGAVEVKTATWIERCSVAQEFIDELTGFVLDLGERESIALALQMGADLLILDEITGRKAARQETSYYRHNWPFGKGLPTWPYQRFEGGPR